MFPQDQTLAIAADLRAGAIDAGAVLMIADVLLQAIAELPGGRDLITAALARKVEEVTAFPPNHDGSRASLMVMREIVMSAMEPVDRAAA